MGKMERTIKTTTRSGEKVEVRVGTNDAGFRVTMLADGRGYESQHREKIEKP